ncbi:PASTA domain-containing protein [Planctomycetes bacterium CA13]
MKTSNYQHKTDIDETTGRFKCDCSGLMGYALRREFPEHYLALRGDLAPWKSRPLAATFYETFDRAGEKGDGLWMKIRRMKDAVPGDLIAWRKPNLERGRSTGHVCMILSVKIEPDGRFRVRVLDSTDKSRVNDTRTDGRTGLGSGEMWFEADHEGRPIAYTPRETSGRINSNPILIGRLLSGEKSEAVTDLADRDLIGLDTDEAASLARNRGLKWRIIARDDSVVPIGLSRRNPKRLNAVIEEGKVIRVRRD